MKEVLLVFAFRQFLPSVTAGLSVFPVPVCCWNLPVFLELSINFQPQHSSTNDVDVETGFCNYVTVFQIRSECDDAFTNKSEKRQIQIR